MAPDRTKERIIDIASTQFEDGGAYHQYQPLTKRGNDEIGGNFIKINSRTMDICKKQNDYSIFLQIAFL